jgi:hypothetical protein
MATRGRTQVTFKLSKSIVKFMSDARALKLALTTAPGNLRVTVSPESIASFDANMAALVKAQVKVKSGLKGAATNRNIIWAKTKNNVRNWIRTVQQAVDRERDVNVAYAIIADSGMKPRKKRTFGKEDIEVRCDGRIPCLVHLISKAAKKGVKVTYEWEVSRNGKTWTPVKAVPYCKTTWQTGVPQGTLLHFRKRITTGKSGRTTAWSIPFSLIIV